MSHIVRTHEPQSAQEVLEAVRRTKLAFAKAEAEAKKTEWQRYREECAKRREADRLRTIEHYARQAAEEAAQPQIVIKGPTARDWLRLASNHPRGILALSAAEWAKRIVARAAKWHGFRYEDLVGARQLADIVAARHLAIQVILHSKRCTSLSVPQVGKIMGGRDHSTILHAAGRAPSFRARFPKSTGKNRARQKDETA
jgi:chromosomal replication initiation ATPase DnaA